MAEAVNKSLEEIDFCLNKHPTYSHRIDNPGDYNWCIVEHHPWDVILFAGIAVVLACISQGPFSSLIVLVGGGILMGFAYPFNLRQLGNAVALWLGIEPYELFFYIFLPPLLLDAALKIDWYAFKKVVLNVITLAFLVVMGTCAILIPVMLYMFYLKSQGWQWYHAALFGSMIASTDAVAIIAVLKKCGGPERLRILLEGESLLNDASSITLFTIFIGFVIDAAEGKPTESSAGTIIGQIIKDMIWLAVGGGLIGLAFGIATRYILRILQRFGASFEQQIALTLANGYLAFYVANAPAKKSGVIAVAIFGLYGASTSKFDISSRLEESGAFNAFWDSFALIANGIVFYFAGASSLNFVIRSADSLGEIDQQDLFSSLWRAPLIWLVLNVLRFIIISLFKPLFWAGKAPLTFRDVIFLSASGLRGSVSLILAQAVVTEVPQSRDPVVQKVQSEVVLFTAVFVLLTLLVNAPMLPFVLRWTRLDRVPPQHQKMRRKALRLLVRETEAAIEELRDDAHDILRGVDWDAVRKYVDVSKKLESFVNPHDRRSQSLHSAILSQLKAAYRRCCRFWRRANRETGVPPPVDRWINGDMEMGERKKREDFSTSNGFASTSGASSAWDRSHHAAMPSQPSEDRYSDGNGQLIAEFGDELEGEVPFLTAKSMGLATHAGSQDDSRSGRLPTHTAYPKMPSSNLGHDHGPQSAHHPRSRRSPNTSNVAVESEGDSSSSNSATVIARQLRPQKSMRHALQMPCSNLEMGVEYSSDVDHPEDGSRSYGRRSSVPGPTTEPRLPKSPRPSPSVPDMRTEVSELIAIQKAPAPRSAPAPRGSHDAPPAARPASHDDPLRHTPLATALSGMTSEHTIKRQGSTAHRSLAGLFGGSGGGVTDSAPPQPDPKPSSLQDQFAKAPPKQEPPSTSDREPQSSATTSDPPDAADHASHSKDSPGHTVDNAAHSTPSSSANVASDPRPTASSSAAEQPQADDMPEETGPGDRRRSMFLRKMHPHHQSRRQSIHTGYEDAEAGAYKESNADEARHRAAVAEGSHLGGNEFVCDAPVQRYGFRARRTEVQNNQSSIVDVDGTSAPCFGTSAAVLHPQPPHGSDSLSAMWADLDQSEGDSSSAPRQNTIGGLQPESDSLAALLSPRNPTSAQDTWHTGVLAKRANIKAPFSDTTPTTTVNRGSTGQTSHRSSIPEELEVAQPTAEEVADMRARIYAGMKRYFYTKSNAGLLSHKGLRILDHCCDLEIDNPNTPLALWEGVEGEVTGGWGQSFMVRVVFKIRRFGIQLKRSHWKLLRWLLGIPMSWFTNIGQRVLSKKLLLSCEVAMEYLLALTNSPQVRWLREHEGSAALMAEVEAECKRVWKFIIDREIEAPERFRAIQSYRAAMAVLRQQEAFVERMVHAGMVTPQEASLMSAPLEESTRLLVHRGPVWRAPLVIDVLRSLPIMRDVPVKVLEQVLTTGHLIMYRSNRQIHESAPHEGIFIVVSGLVRVRYDVWRGTHQTYFLGTGGIFGLFSALTGETLEGRVVAIAEGNALGKGPVVFEIPPSGIALIRSRAAEGNPVFMQLEVDMFRLASLYLMERLESRVLTQLYKAISVFRASRRQSATQADGAETAGAVAAKQRLRSLFNPPGMDAAGQVSSPSPLSKTAAGGANPARQSNDGQSRGPRASSAFSGRQSMAWMLEAAHGEDTVGASSPRRDKADAASAAKAQRRGTQAAAEQRSIQRQAEVVFKALRLQLWGAELVELPPACLLPYRCSVVVLRGTVNLTTPGRPDSCADAATQDQPQQGIQHSAPAILPWVWDVSDPSGSADGGDEDDQGDASSAAYDSRRRIEVSEEGQLTGGPRGATLVIAAHDDSILDALLSSLPSQTQSGTAPGHGPVEDASIGRSIASSASEPSSSMSRALPSIAGIKSALGRSSRAVSRLGQSSSWAPALDSPRQPGNGHVDGVRPAQRQHLNNSSQEPRSYQRDSGNDTGTTVSAADDAPSWHQEWHTPLMRRSSRRLSAAGSYTGELHGPRPMAAFGSHAAHSTT